MTAKVVMALPHRDRSHIGIASTDRLKRLWTPMGAPLQLSYLERAAAASRAHERDTPRIRIEVPPLSVPVQGPFHADSIWTFKDQHVVALAVDPFPVVHLVLVSEDLVLRERIERSLPRGVTMMHACSADDAKRTIIEHNPTRIVCAESMALGEAGLLAWMETTYPERLSQLEILCDARGADCVEQYLALRAHSLEILEEPLEDDTIEALVWRAKPPYP